MTQEQCWWKAALTGTTIAIVMAGASFGIGKGAKALFDETKDLVRKYVPNYDWSRLVAGNMQTEKAASNRAASLNIDA